MSATQQLTATHKYPNAVLIIPYRDEFQNIGGVDKQVVAGHFKRREGVRHVETKR